MALNRTTDPNFIPGRTQQIRNSANVQRVRRSLEKGEPAILPYPENPGASDLLLKYGYTSNDSTSGGSNKVSEQYHKTGGTSVANQLKFSPIQFGKFYEPGQVPLKAAGPTPEFKQTPYEAIPEFSLKEFGVDNLESYLSNLEGAVRDKQLEAVRPEIQASFARRGRTQSSDFDRAIAESARKAELDAILVGFEERGKIADRVHRSQVASTADKNQFRQSETNRLYEHQLTNLNIRKELAANRNSYNWNKALTAKADLNAYLNYLNQLPTTTFQQVPFTSTSYVGNTASPGFSAAADAAGTGVQLLSAYLGNLQAGA